MYLTLKSICFWELQQWEHLNGLFPLAAFLTFQPWTLSSHAAIVFVTASSSSALVSGCTSYAPDIADALLANLGICLTFPLVLQRSCVMFKMHYMGRRINYLRGWHVGRLLNEIISSQIISICKHEALLLKQLGHLQKCETWFDLISGSIWEADPCISAVIQVSLWMPSMIPTIHYTMNMHVVGRAWYLAHGLGLAPLWCAETAQGQRAFCHILSGCLSQACSSCCQRFQQYWNSKLHSLIFFGGDWNKL